MTNCVNDNIFANSPFDKALFLDNQKATTTTEMHDFIDQLGTLIYDNDTLSSPLTTLQLGFTKKLINKMIQRAMKMKLIGRVRGEKVDMNPTDFANTIWKLPTSKIYCTRKYKTGVVYHSVRVYIGWSDVLTPLMPNSNWHERFIPRRSDPSKISHKLSIQFPSADELAESRKRKREYNSQFPAKTYFYFSYCLETMALSVNFDYEEVHEGFDQDYTEANKRKYPAFSETMMKMIAVEYPDAIKLLSSYYLVQYIHSECVDIDVVSF